MPEEIILAIQLTKSSYFNEKAIDYVTAQLNDMEVQEVSSIFSAITTNTTGFNSGPEAQRKILRFNSLIIEYFKTNINKLDDKALA